MEQVVAELRSVVEAQANARVRQDAAAFASYMTPAALLQLRTNGSEPADVRPTKFEIVQVNETGDRGISEVRYAGAGSSVLHQEWHRTEGGWQCVEASRPAGLIQQPWWRRLLPSRARPAPERRELE